MELGILFHLHIHRNPILPTPKFVKTIEKSIVQWPVH